MERYDYYETIKSDLETFIEDNYDLNNFEDIEEAYEKIYDDEEKGTFTIKEDEE